jgi:adenosylhomocysteine nucleosidase
VIPVVDGSASPFVVLVCAEVEWRAVRGRYESAVAGASPFGSWLAAAVADGPRTHSVVFLHTGVGKIRATAAAQYAVGRWQPPLLVNLGTCGGFGGVIERGEVVLVDRAVVYDMVDRTAEREAVLDGCDTRLDLSWLGAPHPAPVRVGPMLSADRDLLPADMPRLRSSYGAVAADWESAAIAYVAHANRVPALILRGVSDLVGPDGGEAYGDPAVFLAGAARVMEELLGQLPLWLSRWP